MGTSTQYVVQQWNINTWVDLSYSKVGESYADWKEWYDKYFAARPDCRAVERSTSVEERVLFQPK